MNEHRTKNSIKNIITAMIGQVISIIIVFISRKIFLNYLSADYLGINGLFTNILSMLSLAELGVGTAIIYSLYKPIAENDTHKINALMNFYKKAYITIGFVVLLLGIAIYPFLDIIIKDKPNIPNINMFFLIFLLDSVITYFYAYKRSIIIANQKQYVVTSYKYIFLILLNISQIIILVTTKNYLLYILSKVVLTIIENIVISKKANKLFPDINYNNKEKLDKTSKTELVKNIKAMLVHRIGGIVVNGTDNILISSLIGIYWVGLYSNYYLVISALNSIIGQAFASVTASIGNLNAVDSKEKSYSIYKSILFSNFWISMFVSITVFIVINNFIQLWIGSEFVVSIYLTLILVLNFYITCIRKTTLIFRDSMGLFYQDRFKPIAESIINLVASIILAKYYGIIGIFIGTFISTITTCFWVEPYILYKYGFKKNVKEYFVMFFKYTLVAVVAAFITWYLCSFITTITWISLVIKLIICAIVPNILYLLVFHKTDEFKYFYNIFKRIKNK